MPSKIELNEDFKQALVLLETTSRHVFITGKAGTGKSTLLELFRAGTRKRVAVLAPTGVAAVNVRGQTIHSFFGFRPDITLEKVKHLRVKDDELYQALDMLVIDEVSMVRPDLLDCMDAFLRWRRGRIHEPFGGVQMAFFGDLYQLPPVVTSREKDAYAQRYASAYFFDADVVRHPDFSLELLELGKIYRQTDQTFIALLNAVRNNSVTDHHLRLLNGRLAGRAGAAHDQTVHLTATNQAAAAINEERLAKLRSKVRVFKAEWDGAVTPEHLPAETELRLKIHAQVMLLNNDPQGRWVNGTMGQVKKIVAQGEDGPVAHVRLADGETVEVSPISWDLFRYVAGEKPGTIETEAVGRFTQLPLRLAWAVTIHKSQGKTFDRVEVDAGAGFFATGQLYVALSRCRTLEGITLTRRIEKRHIRADYKVMEFLTRHQYRLAEERLPLKEKLELIRRAIEREGLLDMVYLKSNEEKTRRRVRPVRLGRMHYQNREFIGLEAQCALRRETRVFRVDRILELTVVEDPAEACYET